MNEQQKMALRSFIEGNYSDFLEVARVYLDKEECKQLLTQLGVDTSDFDEEWGDD